MGAEEACSSSIPPAPPASQRRAAHHGGYLLYAALTHERVFDYRPGDVYWCTADVGWVTGHSYIVYGRWPMARPR